ncbi:MAG: DUF1385 domain-containing protein [Dehalococcoidia bacterium]|nr:DUF1385 domain-containing protein [Dehalococcoidia bacterium]
MPDNPQNTLKNPNSVSNYGGQALIEGVLIRGRKYFGIALRTPEGEIITATDSISSSNKILHYLKSIPFVRGLSILAESMVIGSRSLRWSSAIAAGDTTERSKIPALGKSGAVGLVITLSISIVFFFIIPVLFSSLSYTFFPIRWLSLFIEGFSRLLFLVGYIWVIGKSDEIRRVFQYHAAEHQTIQAYEQQTQINVASIRRQAKEHPRCGTSFLLTVVLVSGILLIFVGSGPFWWHIVSRILFIPIIAGIAYEIIRIGSKKQSFFPIKLLLTCNIALQKLTTSKADDEQIQVAIAAFETVRNSEDNED